MKTAKKAPGQFVTVNGHKMHIFIEGHGPNTFVLMSGFGTAYPTKDFRPLWSLLGKKHRVAVVEKAGYGWSEVTNNPRDMDSIL